MIHFILTLPVQISRGLNAHGYFSIRDSSIHIVISALGTLQYTSLGNSSIHMVISALGTLQYT